jgi:hypothetical protein
MSTSLSSLSLSAAKARSNSQPFESEDTNDPPQEDPMESSPQKSVSRLVEEFNASPSSNSASPMPSPHWRVSPFPSPSTKPPTPHHRPNPSRDIRVTYLRQIEGKDEGIYQRPNDGAPVKGTEKHVSFPQWSADEFDSLQARDRRDSSTLGPFRLLC